jgi:hypothetical protein
MPRRPAKVTQADISRALRAAKEAGANSVTIDGNGIIRIAITASADPIKSTNDLDGIWTPCSALSNIPKAGETHLTQLMRSRRFVRLQALVLGESQCLSQNNAIPVRPGTRECRGRPSLRPAASAANGSQDGGADCNREEP